MATTTEEIILRMALDPSASILGTQKMMDVQKKAAMDYAGFWETALAKKDSAEQAQNIKSIARQREMAAQSLRINSEMLAKMKAEQEAFNASAAVGSIPANMAGGTAKKAENAALKNFEAGAEQVGGGYVFSKSGKLLGKIGANGEIEKDIVKGAEGAAEHATGTAIKQEALVLVRETFRGAGISKIIASAMRLISLAGDSIAGLALTYVAIPGAIAAAFFEGLPKLIGKFAAPDSFLGKNYGTSVGDWWAARKGEKTGAADLKSRQKSAAEMLRKRIDLMQSHGLIDDSKAQGLRNGLDNPDGTGIIAAFNATNSLMSKSKSFKSAEEITKQNAEKQKKLDDEIKANRTVLQLKTDIEARQKKMADYAYYLNKLDLGSIPAKQVHGKLLDMQIAQEQDLTKLKKTQAELDKKSAEAAKQSAEAAAKAAAIETERRRGIIGNMLDETVYPTLANFAGNIWTNNLNRRYGRGGRFDLGRGNGPMAATAREYLLAQKQQEWDRTYGHNAAAEHDRQRMIAARDRLVESGAASPTQLLSKMEGNIDKINRLWNALVKNGAIKTTIASQ